MQLRFVLMLSFLGAMPRGASPHVYDRWLEVCPSELGAAADSFANDPIAAGCEFPGCDPSGDLTWRMELEGSVFASAVLQFEIPAQGLVGLTTDGTARIEGTNVIVEPGQGSVSGLPMMVSEVVPVAVLAFRVAAPPNGFSPPASEPAADLGEEIVATSTFLLEQVLEGEVVRDRRIRVDVKRCGPADVSEHDTIALQDNLGMDRAVTLVDARRFLGCRNDELWRSPAADPAEVLVENVLRANFCRSTVLVLSDDNAALYQGDEDTWRDDPGDRVSILLEPLLEVPLHLWLARPDARQAALDESANANYLYNGNNVGLLFDVTIHDVSGVPVAVNAIGTTCPSPDELSGSEWHESGALNVYYVENDELTGDACAVNHNIMFLGTSANLATLAHELGHALGLRPKTLGGHTNGRTGFGDNNIMWGGGPPTRDHFSVGQAFRMNFHEHSQLFENGNRTEGEVDCPPNWVSTTCIALEFDALPH